MRTLALSIALFLASVAHGQTVFQTIVNAPAPSGCGNHGTTFTRLQNTAVDQSSSVASQNLAYTSNVACNSLLVVVVRGASTLTSITITDTIGNTWSNGTFHAVASNSSLQISWAVNTTSAADTVTVTPNASSSLRIVIMEYSGVNTSTPLDQQKNSNNGTSTTPDAGTNLTPGGTNELVIGAVAITSTATYTAGTNFTLVNQIPTGSTGKLGTEEWIQTTATATNAPATLGTSGGWVAAMAIFNHG